MVGMPPAHPRPDAALLARLYEESAGSRWALARADFDAALDASIAHAFAGRQPDAAEVARYAASLHLADLALAAACRAGSAAAWEHFIAEHRPLLYRAADAIDPTGRAREVADSLYGDLYGLKEREGARQSLFRYFLGRSRLGTWLRAVLSQRHIDQLRAGRKLDALPEDEAALPAAAASDGANAEPAALQGVVQAALTAEIAALPPRDRLRLSCYYVQGMKLAAIGRALKEHEATVSRHLTRTRAAIKDGVVRRLRTDHGLSVDAITECLAAAARDSGMMDLAELVGAAPEHAPGPKPVQASPDGSF
jgi:RNA polymerase sigma-70 factor (ECF subfamily)